MIGRDQAEQLREQLMAVLAEDAHNAARLGRRLDALTRETGVGAHAALLMILARQAYDEDEARRHWQAILEHRSRLSQALEREVGVRVALLDYFMNVNRRLVRPTLIDVDMQEQGEASALTDPLTGLAVAAAFRQAVDREVRRARRYGKSVAVVLFDLDDFARINADFGGLVADRLIREAAILLNNHIRDIDMAARPGEDELALLLPETGSNSGMIVAERYRREIEAHFLRREAAGRPVRMTVSGGIAVFPEHAKTADRLLQAAVGALYRAKASGRNAIRLFAPERRRYLRFDLDPDRFEIEVLAPKEAGRSRPRNLSRDGLLFVSAEPLEVGEEIELRMIERDGEEGHGPRLRGRVVRLEAIEPVAEKQESADPEWARFEIGVAFEPQDVDDPRRLLSFLERVRSAR